jgi:hypothetical protein
MHNDLNVSVSLGVVPLRFCSCHALPTTASLLALAIHPFTIGKPLIDIEVVNLCLCFFIAWWPYIIVLCQYSVVEPSGN